MLPSVSISNTSLNLSILSYKYLLGKKNLHCCHITIFFIYCNGLPNDLSFPNVPFPRAFSILQSKQSSSNKNLSMSSLFSKHISGFFLLLGKTEVLPKALAHLLNLPDTLLCPILCSPATWPSPALYFLFLPLLLQFLLLFQEFLLLFYGQKFLLQLARRERHESVQFLQASQSSLTKSKCYELLELVCIQFTFVPTFLVNY